MRILASIPTTHKTHQDKTQIHYPSYGEDAKARARHDEEAALWMVDAKREKPESLEYLVAIAMYNWHKSQRYLTDPKQGTTGTYIKFSEQFDKARFKVNRYKP